MFKEGFGLPPVESLWLGVPVITNGVPSVESLGEQGIYRIKELSSKLFKGSGNAVFMDNDFLKWKRSEGQKTIFAHMEVVCLLRLFFGIGTGSSVVLIGGNGGGIGQRALERSRSHAATAYRLLKTLMKRSSRGP